MRRIVLLTVVAVSACAASPVALAHGTRQTRATVEACHTGLSSADRYVTFGGRMSALPSSQRMQMRFDLLVRRGHGWYRRVTAPGLGIWQSTADGVGLFRYHQQVAALGAPGSYRALVHFRWLDAQGAIVRTSRRFTRTCRQPDLRPDLVARQVWVRPSAQDPSQATYGALVANRGMTAAGPFAVSLAIDGTDQGTRSVGGLASRRWTTVTWTAPTCSAGQQLRVGVDAAGQVAESHEADDVRLVTCPTQDR